jgi:DNA-directed RNA polymerase beta subunit
MKSSDMPFDANGVSPAIIFNPHQLYPVRVNP